MTRTLTPVLLVLAILLAAGCATVSTSGNYTLRGGNTLRGDLYITSGQATLEEGSQVAGSVIMTSGVLNADGEIDGDIVMSSGKINLGPKAIVHGDIRGTSGDVNQAEGSRVDGQILTNQSGFTVNGGLIAGLIGKYCLLPVVLLGLIIYLLVGFTRRQPTAQAEYPATIADPSQKLRQLKKMLDDSLISDAEYEAKKAEILADL